MYERRRTAYRDTEVLSSSAERLIPLMYEKLLVSLKRGAVCMRAGDIAGKHENLQRAQDLVYELLSSLDFDHGGEIATRLASLYAFWAREISQAGHSLQAGRLDKVADMVASLHESWVEAVRAVEASATPVGTAGRRA
jgi:flagellar secretion chaperone FliS